jgi:hypothetical protein
MSKVMVSKWTALLLGCIALNVATASHAANSTPDKTGAFVAYCAGHFADCKSKIVEVDVAVLATKVLAKKGTDLCAIPKGVGNDVATKEILLWLGDHKNVHAMATEDAIQAAVKALWHCKLQIGDGAEPGGPPAKTGPFVDYCATHYVNCANEMVAVSVSIMATEHSKHCLPPDSVETKEMTVAALGWLGQHKETYNLDTDAGINAAFDHLWPCH